MRPVFVGKALIGHREGPRRREGEPLPPGERLRLVRIDEIEKLIRARRDVHGIIPEDAALVALVDHGAAAGTVRYWRPELDGASIDGIVGRATGRRWSAKALGEALELDLDERATLDIRSIRAKGQTKADQRAANRQANRDRMAARRASEGVRTRAEYLADATSTKWLAAKFGVSRKTVRRWLASGKITPEKVCPTCVRHTPLVGTEHTHGTPQAEPSTEGAAPPPEVTADNGAARPSAEPAPGAGLVKGISNTMATMRNAGRAMGAVMDRHDAAVHRLVASLAVVRQAGAVIAPAADQALRRGAG